MQPQSSCLTVSQIVLLLRRACELGQPPLLVAVLILQRASADLEGSHRHPRSDFCELDVFVAGFDEDVVADFDVVVDVLEGYDLVGLAWLEKCLFGWRI